MKEGMKEPYVEGVAIHDDPEPCGCMREQAAEALARGTCRQGYWATKWVDRGADAAKMVGRQH